MKPNELEFAAILDALKVPQCRRIIEALASNSKDLQELAKATKLSEKSLELHLPYLLDAKLVSKKVTQGQATYVFNSKLFDKNVAWFLKVLQHQIEAN